MRVILLLLRLLTLLPLHNKGYHIAVAAAVDTVAVT